MKKTKGEGEYVRTVQKNTAQYVKDLLQENEKLRGLVHTLETELDIHKREKMKLEEQVATMEVECKRYLDRYVDVELQNTNVANLYVASLRLHTTLHRADVLAAIQEIVINLIGSEELAIYEASGESLTLISSFGVDDRALATAAVGAGIIGRCVASAETYIATADKAWTALPAEANMTACVPLVVDGKVKGAIAIFRLLEHKRALEDVDHELFALLGTQGAVALYCSALVAR